jgi:hypothetical protein
MASEARYGRAHCSRLYLRRRRHQCMHMLSRDQTIGISQQGARRRPGSLIGRIGVGVCVTVCVCRRRASV